MGWILCQSLIANEPFERDNPQVFHCRQALQNAWYAIVMGELRKMSNMLSLRADEIGVAIHKKAMDCHEFTRLRFANSRNDKQTFVILSFH